jgi:signal peptide peptidase SppA
MARDSAILAFMCSQAWMLHKPVFERALAVIERHSRGEVLGDDAAAEVARTRANRRSLLDFDGLGGVDATAEQDENDKRPLYVSAGRVAIVPVHGMIAKYASMVNGISSPSGMTVNRVVRAVTAACQSRDAETVVLDIDSPGGTVAGGEDLVEVFRMNRAGKLSGKGRVPIVAYCHDLTASGGYLAASWADRVVCGESSLVGCMGVYQVIEDSSEMYAKMGVKRRVVSSGAFKGAFAEGVPVPSEHVKMAQDEVDKAAAWYIKRVAEGRQASVESIADLADGRCWTGQDAVDAGLCDGVSSFGALVAELNAVGGAELRKLITA